MAASRSEALVLFGATGDLAHKMSFPASLCHGEPRHTRWRRSLA